MSTFTFLSRALRPPTRIPVESPDCCISLKLMRLCGLISSDSNGVHAFRPDLFRSLRKLENLVDEKMIELGAQRILLPTLGPRYLWEKSDLYTFDTCAEAAGKTYIRMKTAYMELFNSLKLPLIIACADPGNVGGEVSDEFHILLLWGGQNTSVSGVQLEYEC
ncbi:unnamed protein product [Heterobilharzia americana]|nr:unnamed protein product [Heterobilharzia americana]